MHSAKLSVVCLLQVMEKQIQTENIIDDEVVVVSNSRGSRETTCNVSDSAIADDLVFQGSSNATATTTIETGAVMTDDGVEFRERNSTLLLTPKTVFVHRLRDMFFLAVIPILTCVIWIAIPIGKTFIYFFDSRHSVTTTNKHTETATGEIYFWPFVFARMLPYTFWVVELFDLPVQA